VRNIHQRGGGSHGVWLIRIKRGGVDNGLERRT
jgi:hypothetical protein